MSKVLELEQALLKSKLMCIFRVNDISADTLLKASEACVKNGARFIEITYNHEEYEDKTFEVIKNIKAVLKEEAYVGCGTVLTIEEAKRAIEAGADFIVSPILNLEVLNYAQENDVYYMPGVLSATEAYEAYSRGAHIVKLFPTGELGLDYAKALMKPLGFIKYFAVGKMTTALFEECLEAGFVGAGISSSINSREILTSQNYELIGNKVKEYVAIAQKHELSSKQK